MDEFQKQMYDIFAFETNTFLDQIETILMQAESGEGNILNDVSEIFRIMHTIKSSSAMMGFNNMSSLSHAMEDLFHFIRDKRPENVDKKKLTDIIFSCADYIKRNLKKDGTQEDPAKELATVRHYLAVLKGEAAPDPPQALEAAPLKAEETKPPPIAPAVPTTLVAQFVPNCQMITVRAFEITNKISQLVQDARFEPADNAPDAAATLAGSGLRIILPGADFLPEVMKLLNSSPFVRYVREGNLEIVAIQERRSDPVRQRANYMSIEIKKLDALINLTGEMIIASMGAEHDFLTGDREKLEHTLHTLHALVLQTQEMAFGLRMLPLRDMFHQLHRSVRDAAGKVGKDITFHMVGEDNAMDKKVIEDMFAPLQHLLRNAVDHGIESADERIKKGKPESGTVTLSAMVEGNNAVLSVADDGAGISREWVINKAVSMGLVEAEKAESLSDREVFAFIALPGFSTKEQVSELSGRGVGMDVVNDSVQKLNGSIHVESAPDKGTTISVTIPITLTILHVMLVSAGENTVAIPLLDINEIFAVDPSRIRRVNGCDTLLHKNACYPIVSLEERFQETRSPYESGIMLVLSCGKGKCAVFAKKVIGHTNVVVKPVPTLFSAAQDVYGLTILGDGSVSLIMDGCGFLKTLERGKGNGTER